MIYGKRSSGKQHGTVYTNREVVDFIIRLSLDGSCLLSGKVIIEPSAGDGAFVIALIERIIRECSGDRTALKNALSKIYVYEMDPDVIPELMNNIALILGDPDLVEAINIHVGDFLLAEIPKADIIVGNPPYVRYDNIPIGKKEAYKALFSSFKARCDIYVLFIEKSIKALKPDGRLGFICADRWLNNQYGKTLRGLIKENFHMKYFFKFSGYNPFQEEVIAYPSVFLIENTGRNKNIYFSKIESENDLKSMDYTVKSKLYCFGDNAEIEYDDLKDRFLSLEEQGFKIGIGVATGADKVFITKDLNSVESELLVPLVSRKDFFGNTIRWRGFYLINTYSASGSGLVDLKEFPRLKEYLESRFSEVTSRYIAKRNEAAWYKLIDPVHKDLRFKPKLLIPDITTKRSIIFDSGKYYPHHNLYYITCQNQRKLLILRSILVSDFCSRQVAQKGVLMNGGALRWQAQTLRKLYLPDITKINTEVGDLLIHLYDLGDFEAINSVIDGIDSHSLSVTKETVNLRNSARHSVQPDLSISWVLP